MGRGSAPGRRPFRGSGAVLVLTGLFLIAFGAGRSGAIYATLDVVDVPLARLIETARARVEEERSARTVESLARLHGMAYAWGLGPDSDVPSVDGESPYFGWGPSPLVPYRRAPLIPEENGRRELAPREQRSPAMLDEAIRLYRESLQLAQSDGQRHLSSLGLAWCLRERSLLQRSSSDAAEAADLLRAIVRETGPAILQSRSLGLGPVFPVEAGRDLIALLESGDVPPTSATEVRDVEKLIADIEALPRPVTPLALDLQTADGAAPDSLVDLAAAVPFDLDGTGFRRKWTWITPRAAWIVWDPRSTGEIGGALQLFGTRTFNLFHSDGFAALAMLDDDGDGVLRGAELTGLAAWRDADGDGVSEPGELTALGDLGVVELEVSAEVGEHGWLVSRRGARLDDGSALDVWDLILETAAEETTRLHSSWMRP